MSIKKSLDDISAWKLAGTRVKQVRMSRNLTQKEFAETLGVSQGFLSEVEKGIKPASDTFFIALINLYKINEKWLLTGDGPIFREEKREVLNLQLMKEVIEHVEELFKKKKYYLPPRKKAEFIALLYEDILEDESRRENLNERVVRLFKIAG